MKIIEYNDNYAELVADMWNKSNSSWGNDDAIKTKNDVINREANSGNIKLYIAIDNEEVVGYCSFSEYQHDEGASYLPLLNVRPDYHGKKVGKQLILRVLEDAIQAKWPRFDLFTWSGNIKAMPLYKKCGFFWERNNRTVHLMNFLPTVFKTEAIKEYMEQLDWYHDSKRIIDMNQDGECINGFDYYQYHFENEKTSLKVQFEKSGRGLRFIETPDYLIEMTLDQHDLVYNQEYNVTYRIKNKNGKPLSITLEGVNNKNIKSTFNETFNVVGECVVKEPFYVEQTTEIQEKMKTYPVVESNVYINGKKAVFKVGLEPKCPVFLNLQIHHQQHILETEYEGYLDIENNLEKTTTFNITLPEEYITVLDRISLTMKPKEKRSVTFKYTVKDFGFIKGNAMITYNDESITTEVMALIKGHDNTFHAVIHETAFVIDGPYSLMYDISHARFSGDTLSLGRPPFAFTAPQIGLPYSIEFSNIKPKISFPSSHQMDALYKSEAFKDVDVTIHMENKHGIISVYYELTNRGPKRELALSIPMWANLNDSYIPYKNHLLQTNATEGLGVGSIDNDLLDENWIYNKKEKTGICWDKREKVTIIGWMISAIKEGIILDTNETYKTHNFYISFAHKDMKQFRAFAGQMSEKEELKIFDLNVNEGNPFVTDKAAVSLRNLKKKEVVGTASCDQDTVDATAPLQVTAGLKSIQFDLRDRFIEQKRMIYRVQGDVSSTTKDGVLTIDNGVLTFHADPSYSDSIYSLQFNGHEWLDSNYPCPKARAWWGTFIGGMNTRYDTISDQVALSEKRAASFVTVQDNFGNKWHGIKNTLTIEKEEELKGLTLETYTVTQGGLPLVYNFTNVINHTGNYFNKRYFLRFNTLKADDDKTNVTFELDGVTYKCGNIGIEKILDKLVQLHSSREHSIAFYNPKNEVIIGTQSAYTIVFSEGRMDIPDGQSKQFPGDFILFSKDKLKPEYLKDLDNIKCEV